MEERDAVEPDPWAAVRGEEGARMGIRADGAQRPAAGPQEQASRTQLFPSTASMLGLHPHSQSLQEHCGSSQHLSGSLPFGAALAPSWPGDSHRLGAAEDGGGAQSRQLMALQLPWPQSCF